ncbi:MAG: hypothetical protein GX900_02795 [Clostridiaceae bacterium]|nr:hypothetical protein [Clostridiaceae bacterium]
MANIVFYSLSPALRMQRRLRVILPDSRRNDTNLPWLLLLHSAGADGSRWLRMTRAEYYAEAKGIALVLSDGDNGYYTDMYHGYAYYTYLTEDVEADVLRNFPSLSRDPQRRYVAGFEIGGFGALKYALDFPDRFRAAGSFAGGLDPQSLDPDYCVLAFGSYKQAWQTENDLFNCLRTALTDDARLPDLYFSRRQQDYLYTVTDQATVSDRVTDPDCVTNPNYAAARDGDVASDSAMTSGHTIRVGRLNFNSADPWSFADRSLAWFLDRICPDRARLFTPSADFAEWDPTVTMSAASPAADNSAISLPDSLAKE